MVEKFQIQKLPKNPRNANKKKNVFLENKNENMNPCQKNFVNDNLLNT